MNRPQGNRIPAYPAVRIQRVIQRPSRLGSPERRFGNIGATWFLDWRDVAGGTVAARDTRSWRGLAGSASVGALSVVLC